METLIILKVSTVSTLPNDCDSKRLRVDLYFLNYFTLCHQLSLEMKLNVRGHDIQLNYVRRGEGNETLITFHGFGQSSADMFPMSDAMPVKAYHFDLFYHGRSYWPEALGALSPSLWRIVFEAFLEKEKIDRFSLAGFSMGGKFAIATLNLFPDRINRIMLLAPDGIQTSTWYNLANYPVIVRPYFRSMIVKPQRFYKLVRTIEKYGLMDRGLSKFAAHQMNTRKKRRRVYYSWVMFKPLKFTSKETASLINRYGIDLTIFTGKYDRIITSRGMNRLLRFVPEGHLTELETGHNQLILTAAEHLKRKKM
jgi:pimeloyl-ACP methyl ester carboxylesterase